MKYHTISKLFIIFYGCQKFHLSAKEIRVMVDKENYRISR